MSAATSCPRCGNSEVVAWWSRAGSWPDMAGFGPGEYCDKCRPDFPAIEEAEFQ